MSLNIEKHRVVKKVREERVKRDYVKIHNDKELQALRIERMMENPERPVKLPEPPKERAMPKPIEFNPNIHGSTAGSGSGDFHTYRGDRLREQKRQAWLQEAEEKERIQNEFLEKERKLMEMDNSKTAKNRAKREKAKMRKKIAQMSQEGGKKEDAAAPAAKKSKEAAAASSGDDAKRNAASDATEDSAAASSGSAASASEQ